MARQKFLEMILSVYQVLTQSPFGFPVNSVPGLELGDSHGLPAGRPHKIM